MQFDKKQFWNQKNKTIAYLNSLAIVYWGNYPEGCKCISLLWFFFFLSDFLV